MGDDTYGYAYDPIGNRMSATENTETTEYTANGLNQYSQISAPSVPSVVNPAYDLDGNMLTNGPWAYTWDAENRLVSACSNGVLLVTNVYDHRSRRVRKEVSVWDGQVEAYVPQSSAHYLWDGWNVVRETVAVGSGSTQSVATNYYTWGLDLSGTLQGAGGVGGLLAVLRNGTPYFPCYDANGNVTGYVATNGASVARREYDPFGRTTVAAGTMADDFNFWFSTKYLDHETGMSYYGYRFYSPELGRWLSRDPIEERGGLNLYGFVGNDPVNIIDLFGLDSFSIFYGTGPADGIGSIAAATEQVRSYLAKFQPPKDKDNNMKCTVMIENNISSGRLRWASTKFDELFFFGHGREDTRINPRWKIGQPLRNRNQIIGNNIMFSDGLFHLDKVLTEDKEKVTAKIIYPYVCHDAYVSEENPSGIKVCKLVNNPDPNPSAIGNMVLITVMLDRFKAKKCCRLDIQ